MMKREDVLMEALPYIQQFHGKTIVIKLGGHAMVDPVVLENAIRDAVLLHYVGIRVVLVHGGGPEITEKMKALGKESVFVGGLRVTDQETLEIAQMVLVGTIQQELVSLINANGGRAVSPASAVTAEGSMVGRTTSENRYANAATTTPTASAESRKWIGLGAASVVPGRAINFSRYWPGTTMRTTRPQRIATTRYFTNGTIVPYW